MTLVDLDLGSLDVESKMSGLRVECSSSVSVAPSAEDEIDELRARLMEWSLNAGSNSRLWFARGPNYRVHIVLRFEDVDVLDEDGIVEEVSTCLRNAKLWRQLHMSPTSVETTAGPAHKITVRLEHGDTERSNRQLHKLAVDVPFHDLKPPPGIYIARLSVVQFDMCIRTRSRRKRRKLEKKASISFPIDFTHSNLPVATTHPEQLHEQSRPIPEYCNDQSDRRDLKLHAADWLVEPDEVEDGCDDVDMLLGTSVEDVIIESPVSSQASSLRKRSSSGIEMDEEEEKTNRASIVNLIDAALRLAISDSPRQLAKGINITKSESVHRLADIFPSVWSPGYLPAVSSRAVFIPTISHALKSAFGGRAKKSGLGSDVRDLAYHRNTDQRLWRTLQKALHRLEAARQLKPILSPEGLSTTDSKLLAEEGDYDDDQEGITDALEEQKARVEDVIVEDDQEDDESLLSCDEFDTAYASIREDEHLLFNSVDMDGIDILDLPGLHCGRILDPDGLALGLETTTREGNGKSGELGRSAEDLDGDLFSVCGSLSSVSFAEDEDENESSGPCLISREPGYLKMPPT